MNIFILDTKPNKCVEQYLDTHVVKMTLEYAQLLSTVHRLADGTEQKVDGLIRDGDESLYKRPLNRHIHPTDTLVQVEGKTLLQPLLYLATHDNHPSTQWIMEGSDNYMFVQRLFMACGAEYQKRYHKSHKSIVDLQGLLSTPPKNLPLGSTMPLCVVGKEDGAVRAKSWSEAVNLYKEYYQTKLEKLG